jgi:hypothetical protein
MRFHDFLTVDELVCCGAKDEWHALTQLDSIPEGAKQAASDELLYRLKAVKLLSAAPSQNDKAHLMAVSAARAVDFLLALPSSFLGTHLDNTYFRKSSCIMIGYTGFCSVYVHLWCSS